MVLFYLTNSALDVTAGVLWWVTKNTVSGVYNGVSYFYGNSENTENTENAEDNENSENANEILRKEIKVLNDSINDINVQLKLLTKK